MEINGGFVPSVIEAQALVEAQVILCRAHLLMGPETSEMEISLHGPMIRAWQYLEALSTGKPNRFIASDGHRYSTIKAFFEQEDTDVDKFCVTGNHALDTHGSATCQCYTLASCGCEIDPDETSVCSNCEYCMTCCESGSECFTCDQCSKRRDSSDACGYRNCTSCSDCCEDHYTCQGCEHRVSSTCSNCEHCDNCCNCSFCEACERSLDRDDHPFCNDCDHCDDCCNCESEDGDVRRRFVEFRKYGLVFIDAGRKEFKLNPLHRHISCEIEVDRAEYPENNQKLLAAFAKWKDSVVEDGSLSGGHAHEVNTQPTNGDSFLNHIQDICDGYDDVEASTSEDCGLHVHVDTRDFAFYDVRRLILTYTKVEQALFELCARRRLNEHYSQICGMNYTNMSVDPQTFKRQILGSFYGYASSGKKQLLPKRGGNINVKGAKQEKYTDVRYRALNVHSHFHRKSIEFRHHEGTVDAKEITNWSLTVANVVQSAHVSSEAKINSLSNNPREALMQITPVSLHEYFSTKWSKWDVGHEGEWDKAVAGMEGPFQLPTEEPEPLHRKAGRGGKKRCKVTDCGDCMEEDRYRARMLERATIRAIRETDPVNVAPVVVNDPLEGCDCTECTRIRGRAVAQGQI